MSTLDLIKENEVSTGNAQYSITATTWTIQLWELSNGVTLQYPLQVLVSTEGNEIKAEVPELEICAFADNQAEALQEVAEEIEDLNTEIRALPNSQLGTYPQNWKAFLDFYIK